MEILIIAVVVLAVVWLLGQQSGDTPDNPAVEVRPDPMPDLPENAQVLLDGHVIGSITPNPTQGGWSAANSDRAMHGISSKENAIAALIREHYRG